MVKAMLGTKRIQACAEIESEDKVAELAADMRASGWQGRPLLVMPLQTFETDPTQRDADWQALTGAHRLAAAIEIGMETVPCALLPDAPPPSDEYDEPLYSYLDSIAVNIHYVVLEVLEEYGVDKEIRDLLAEDAMYQEA